MKIHTVLAIGVFALVSSIPCLAGAKDPGGTDRFLVTGVIFVEGGGGMAWVQEPTFTQNQVVTVRPGDAIGPYRLARVLEDGIELEGPSGKVKVPLYGGRPVGVAGTPASPAAQQPPVRHTDAAQTEAAPTDTAQKNAESQLVETGSGAPVTRQQLDDARAIVRDAQAGTLRERMKRVNETAAAAAKAPRPEIAPNGSPKVESIAPYILGTKKP